jgi:hypothetical protein
LAFDHLSLTAPLTPISFSFSCTRSAAARVA